MSAFFWIGLGGALGSISRYWLSMHVDRVFVGAMPWGTLACNVVGSLLIGFFAQIFVTDRPMWLSAEARQGVMVGVLGGFTTFSSFSLQTFALIRDEGAWGWAAANVGLNVGLCLAAVALGAWIGTLCRASFQ